MPTRTTPPKRGKKKTDKANGFEHAHEERPEREELSPDVQAMVDAAIDAELDPVPEEFQPAMTRLSQDLKEAARTLDRDGARQLVALYYRIQRFRIALTNRIGAKNRDETKAIKADEPIKTEPNAFVTFAAHELHTLEKNIAKAMAIFTEGQEESRWAKDVYGIGPVLAAGLVAYVDPERSVTAGQLWSFAGLNPQKKWGKGETRPFHPGLKVHAWRIGASFWRTHKSPKSFYGAMIAKRKAEEVSKNERREFRALAEQSLRERNIKDAKLKATYQDGRLPAGRLQLRAQRIGVKLFLAHWLETARKARGLPVPLPYPIAHQGHAHVISPDEAVQKGKQ